MSKYDTGQWEIWIDDLDGELAMVRDGRAKRDVLVVESTAFEAALRDLDSLKKLLRDIEIEVAPNRRGCTSRGAAEKVLALCMDNLNLYSDMESKEPK